MINYMSNQMLNTRNQNIFFENVPYGHGIKSNLWIREEASQKHKALYIPNLQAVQNQHKKYT